MSSLRCPLDISMEMLRRQLHIEFGERGRSLGKSIRILSHQLVDSEIKMKAQDRDF